jgi:hypothetical protein
MDQNTGKILIIAGIILVAAGLLYVFGAPFNIGKLPGDIYIKKGNFSFYFPLTTCIVISAIIAVILYFTGKK